MPSRVRAAAAVAAACDCVYSALPLSTPPAPYALISKSPPTPLEPSSVFQPPAQTPCADDRLTHGCAHRWPGRRRGQHLRATSPCGWYWSDWSDCATYGPSTRASPPILYLLFCPQILRGPAHRYTNSAVVRRHGTVVPSFIDRHTSRIRDTRQPI